MKETVINISDKSCRLITQSFDELTAEALYAIMRLRQEIFIVEQDCPYLDADGVDLSSHHISIYHNDALIAYTRIVPPAIAYPEHSSIGRVVTRTDQRISGIGTHLMQHSIDECLQLHPNHNIKISSQCYIKGFYAKLGFVEMGEEYLEDGIPHIAMVYMNV